MTHHPWIMRALIDLVGIDRIVLASDYDLDMSYQRPLDLVDSIPDLGVSEREMILSGNAARLLNLA